MHEALPLTGKTIVVTRSSEQQSAFTQQLTALGAQVLSLPLLEIIPPSSWEALDQALAEIQSFQWLLLTSANAVEYFLSRAHHQGLEIEDLVHLPLAVVGEKTAAYVQDCGLTPRIIPANFDSEGLLLALQSQVKSGDRVLFPRVEHGGREVVVQTLTLWGATVVQVAAYETRCPLALPPSLQAKFSAQEIDIVTFTSSKTVEHFAQLTAGLNLTPITYAAIGPQTAQTCRERLGRVDIEATTYTLAGLTDALVNAPHPPCNEGVKPGA
jgi:uroporphyrinogen III methyltransferase / synthase